MSVDVDFSLALNDRTGKFFWETILFRRSAVELPGSAMRDFTDFRAVISCAVSRVA